MFGRGFIDSSKLLNSVWVGVCEDWGGCWGVDKCIGWDNGGEGRGNHRTTELAEAQHRNKGCRK